MTFRTFPATLFCPKMYPSFTRELKLLTILFLRCLIVHLPFAKPMPIVSARGIKHPCYLSVRLCHFYEGRGDLTIRLHCFEFAYPDLVRIRFYVPLWIHFQSVFRWILSVSTQHGPELQIDVSTLKRPMLLLELSTVHHSKGACTWTCPSAASWIMYTTEACAALGLVYTLGLIFIWMCLHYTMLGTPGSLPQMDNVTKVPPLKNTVSRS